MARMARQGASGGDDDKAKRLAEALRANLRKRKAQDKARTQSAGTGETDDEDKGA